MENRTRRHERREEMDGQMKRRLDHVVPDKTREYYRFVMVDLPEIGAGMYGMDQKRSDLHSEMCEIYGLTSEETKIITDNIDKIKFGAEGLHSALYDLVFEKSRKGVKL